MKRRSSFVFIVAESDAGSQDLFSHCGALQKWRRILHVMSGNDVAASAGTPAIRSISIAGGCASEHASQIRCELRGFKHGTAGLTFDGREGEIGFVEDADGHVELAVFDPGMRADGGLAAGAEDL